MALSEDVIVRGGATLTIEPGVGVGLGYYELGLGYGSSEAGHLAATNVTIQASRQVSYPHSVGRIQVEGANSSAMLTDCVIAGTNNNPYPVAITSGTGSLTVTRCAYSGSSYVARYTMGNLTLSGNDYSGMSNPRVNVGSTSTSVTWPAAWGLPVALSEDVTVRGGATLTIEPGVGVGLGYNLLGLGYGSSEAGHLVATNVTIQASRQVSYPHRVGRIQVVGANSSATLTDCVIAGANNNPYPVAITSGTGSLTVAGCEYSGSSYVGRYTMGNLTLSGNDYSGMSNPRVNVGSPGTTSTTWRVAWGLPVAVSDYVFVGGSGMPVLTIESGLEVQLGDKRIHVGNSGSGTYPGALRADGVLFAIADDGYIRVYHEGDVQLTSCVFEGSASRYLTVDRGTLSAVNTSFAAGSTAIEVQGDGADVVCHHDTFVGQTSYGVNNTGSSMVDARYCYWGDPSGPSGEGPGSGVSVSENILYDPWLLGWEAGETTQSVVLDFDADAPFGIVAFEPPIIGGVASLRNPLGQTPRIDPGMVALLKVLQAAGKTYDDFQEDVRSRVAYGYSGFNIEVVLFDTESTLPLGRRSRVYYSGPRGDSLLGNVAAVDSCNWNRADDAIVFLEDAFLSVPDPGAEVYPLLVRETADTTAHELGHLLGLVHTERYVGQYMYFQSPSEERSFVGQPLRLRELNLTGETQNDRIALKRTVGAASWVDVGTPGSVDGRCTTRLTESVLTASADAHNVKVIVLAGADVGRSVALGDLMQGEQMSIAIAIGPDEALMFVGSATRDAAHDVFAYFGVPEGNQTADLDPALLRYVPSFSDPGGQTYEGVLLQTYGATFDYAGELDGTDVIHGDSDGDGDLDLYDFDGFPTCLAGPGVAVGVGCAFFDFDVDDDVDLDDFSRFQATFTGLIPIAGDVDGDGDVDLEDFSLWADCLAGPDMLDPPPECDAAAFAQADLDGDDDVDLHDFAVLQTLFMGSP